MSDCFRAMYLLMTFLSLPVFALDLIYTSPPLAPARHERLIQNLESRWKRFQNPSPRMGVRELFAFAIMSAEADYQLGRIARALELAEQMQDLDTESRTYGNFKWYWGDEGPGDLNAVEFSMQDAVLLWMRHRDRLPEDARQRLERLMAFSIEGIRRHGVREDYTNIFLMKTWNCIGLGEQTDRPELAREGYAMLDAWLFYTWEHGIHEYISPTYYGTDLDSLVLIAAFCRNERARQQAESALQLFWTDIAANWFEPCQRLGGSHSRDYDYVTGHGYLDKHMRYAGWLEPGPTDAPSHFATLAQWRPAETFRTLNLERIPRMVRQRWGGRSGERSAHYVGRSISLGTAGASYVDPMDKTLSVQFAGGPRMPVINFLMDARNDPFGKSRESTGGGHMKALHLIPFLMGVQREKEALLLAASSPNDRSFQRFAPNPSCLLSHLVLPRQDVSIWVGDEPCDVELFAPSGQSRTMPVSAVRGVLDEAGLGLTTRMALRLRSKLEVAVPNVPFDVERAPVVEAPFKRAEDPEAKGGKYVWKPGAVGEVGSGGGRALIPVCVPDAGSYYLLARVLAATPSEDSFCIRIRSGSREVLPKSDWHIGVHETWTWVPMRLQNEGPTLIELPAGLALLEVICREDGTKIDQVLLADKRGKATPVPLGTPVFVRHGDAAAGFRVLHAADLRGGTANVELRTEVSAPNAMTLTVVHSAAKPGNGRASVALWTRVEEGLDDSGFAQFRQVFASAQANVAFDGVTLEVSAQGVHGPLRLKGNLDTSERLVCEGDEPGAADALLAIDGDDMGREILKDVPPIAACRRLLDSATSSEGAAVEKPFEAEAAAVILPRFEIGKDAAASGGAFVWQPGEPGGRGGSKGGRCIIPVRVPQSGPYYFWGRVQAPTPDDDSFFIRIRQGTHELLPRSDWHTGVHTGWEWVPMEFGRDRQRAVELPAGLVLLEIMCREDGTKIDQVWLTTDPDRQP